MKIEIDDVRLKPGDTVVIQIRSPQELVITEVFRWKVPIDNLYKFATTLTEIRGSSNHLLMKPRHK